MKRFKIDKRGDWYWEDEEISHPEIKRYLLSLIEKKDNGIWINNGIEKFAVDVEETPFFVEAIREKEDKLKIILNDQTEETLDLTSLRFAKDNSLWCKIKNGKFEAKFTLSAFWQLMEYLVEEEGKFYLKIKDRKYPLKPTNKK